MPKKIKRIKTDATGTARITVRLEFNECDLLNEMMNLLDCWGKPATPSMLIRRAIQRFYDDGFWGAGSRAAAQAIMDEIQRKHPTIKTMGIKS